MRGLSWYSACEKGANHPYSPFPCPLCFIASYCPARSASPRSPGDSGPLTETDQLLFALHAARATALLGCMLATCPPPPSSASSATAPSTSTLASPPAVDVWSARQRDVAGVVAVRLAPHVAALQHLWAQALLAVTLLHPPLAPASAPLSLAALTSPPTTPASSPPPLPPALAPLVASIPLGTALAPPTAALRVRLHQPALRGAALATWPAVLAGLCASLERHPAAPPAHHHGAARSPTPAPSPPPPPPVDAAPLQHAAVFVALLLASKSFASVLATLPSAHAGFGGSSAVALPSAVGLPLALDAEAAAASPAVAGAMGWALLGDGAAAGALPPAEAAVGVGPPGPLEAQLVNGAYACTAWARRMAAAARGAVAAVSVAGQAGETVCRWSEGELRLVSLPSLRMSECAW